ncbi:hypothetical protein [Microbispora rosea]|uniref:hypothetical protein n=1 Tax=Microbispora rosea TaxID=58117 RepID=UPI003412BC4E
MHEITYDRVWRAARKAALAEAEFASPPARRPYDLQRRSLDMAQRGHPCAASCRMGQAQRLSF